MEDKCITDFFPDEFECAECEYKAGTETEMMDHSGIHRGEDDDMIDSGKEISVPDKDSNEIIHKQYVLVNMKSEYDSVNVSDACRMSTNIYTVQNEYIKNTRKIIKGEFDYHENNIPGRDIGEGICENAKIKLEDIDDNYKLSFSSDKITDHENIIEESDPLYIERLDVSHQSHRIENKAQVKKKASKIPGVIVEIDNTGIYIPDGWQRKVYRVTEGNHIGHHRAIYISPCGKILNYRSSVSQHIKYLKEIGIRSPVDIKQIDFTTSSQIENMNKRKSTNRVEIGVDNTNVYIPEGWTRTAFKYLKGSRTRRLFYISPFNREISSYNGMKQYLETLESKGHSLSVDVERLNFSLKSLSLEKKEPKIHGKDVEIDNTGKYIPDGWQRKVFLGSRGYRACYISPSGNILYYKCMVPQHIKYLEKQGIKSPVDVDEMDFSIASHNLTKKKKSDKKVEIEVDNTAAYIPEGWERKAYKYKMGNRQVFYISPFNRLVGSKDTMRRYLATLEQEDRSLTVDIQRLNFSRNDIV